jgi:uncharacterized protein YjgD (DUF1641 family)
MEGKAMAKAITNIEKQVPNSAEEQTQAMEQLLQQAAGHHKPLIKFLNILDEIDKLGILDAAEGMLKNSKQIAVVGLDQLNKPGAHRILKNGMGAVGFLSRIDPNKLQRLLNGVASGVENTDADEATRKPKGLWGVFQSARQPEVMSSLSLMMDFLRGMGSGLKSR